MRAVKVTIKQAARLSLFIVGIFTIGSSAQAMTVTWNFDTGGSDHQEIAAPGTTAPYGNIREFTEDGSTARASAWADSGSGSQFEVAHLGRESSGLGICNQDEEDNFNKCNDSNSHSQVDNKSQEDWLLLILDKNYFFDTMRINPVNEHDRDVSYWIGDVDMSLDLDGVTYADLAGLGFGAEHVDKNSSGSGGINIDLGGLSGNAILFGAWREGKDDRFRVRKLTATMVVPLPATVWLFASGFGLLLWMRKRNALPEAQPNNA